MELVFLVLAASAAAAPSPACPVVAPAYHAATTCGSGVSGVVRIPAVRKGLNNQRMRIVQDAVIASLLGAAGDGFKYAQIRLSPARLSHCMRWLGCCIRAHEIAVDYANRRIAFGKALIDHEGVGFMLAENRIDLQQAELMIDWAAGVGIAGHSMALPSPSTSRAAWGAPSRAGRRGGRSARACHRYLRPG